MGRERSDDQRRRRAVRIQTYPSEMLPPLLDTIREEITPDKYIYDTVAPRSVELLGVNRWHIEQHA